MDSIQPLSDEIVRAAIRENARIAAVRSGPTVPDVQAVFNYHRARSILIALAMGGAEQALARDRDQPLAVTADEIAAVERTRDEILRADPQLARMLAIIEARQRPTAEAAPGPQRRPRRVKSRSVPPEKPPEAPGMVRPVVGYATPKGNPHAFRVKMIAQVWERLERFFRGCTDADPLRPASASLRFSETALALELPGVAAALERAREVLGPSKPMAWSGLGVILPESATPTLDPLFSGGVQHQWDLTANQVDVAIQLMLAGDPWPPAPVPIALLTLLHQFHWTGTDRDGGDTEVSTCITQLASRSTLTPSFLFPFESADDSFLAYLDRVKTLVPVRLSAKNFRLFQPGGRSGTLVPRLFDTSAIAQVLEGV